MFKNIIFTPFITQTQTMKLKHISLLLLTVIVFFCLSSCLKKGEDDPLFSLRTRKARVVGKWKIKSGKEVFTNQFYASGPHFDELTTTFSENSFEQIYKEANSTEISTGSLSYEMEFKKDGEFISTAIYNDASTTVLKGKWDFTGKVGEHKNKDQIVINYTSQLYTSTGTYSVNNSSSIFEGNKTDQTYYIKELRNKKIVLVSEYSSTDNNTSNTYAINSDLTLIQ
jgi:hypothetical protein